MLNLRMAPTLLASLLLVTATSAQEPREPDPLFRDPDRLEITITAPMAVLLKRRPDEEYLPGTLSFIQADGSTAELEIGVRTRGNFRRQRSVCPFPPLRINVDKSQAKGTLFDKQDKLKLVSHCRDRSDRYDQNVLKEYLAYRILNSLTDASYRVRLLRVRYVDSEQDQKERVQSAFFIEHKDRLSHRIELPAMLSEKLQTGQLDGAHSDLTSLFQYLIGNTDFSPVAGAPGETCCHNSTPFGSEGGPVYSIPYDFDMSGLVSAPYAAPNPRFKLRNVRDRLYRGRCMHIGHLDQSVQAFMENREVIYRLLDELEELDGLARRATQIFIDDFYEVIGDPKRLKREIRDDCI